MNFRVTLLLITLVFAVSAKLYAAVEPKDFEGWWTGQISGPDKTAELGIAFTTTEKGLLVSLNFPEMFLYGVNFGPAQFTESQFELTALNLRLSHQGETLSGTFGIAGLPVTLKRGGQFPTEPALPTFPAAPAPLWSVPLGSAVWGSPVLSDGAIFVGTVDGKMHAFHASNGAPAWVWSGEAPCYGTGRVTATDLYFLNDRCELIALDRFTGAQKWITPLVGSVTAAGGRASNETFNHRTATPIIDAKGTLYVGSVDGGIHAIRSLNGKEIWRLETGSKIFAALTLDSERLMVPCFDGTVRVVNMRTRKETSRIKLGGGIVSTPVIVAPQRAVVGARDYMLYGLDLTKSAVAWKDTYWFSWVESTPTLAGGLIYIGGSDYRRVSAINPLDGRTVWSTDVQGLSWGFPMVTSDSVFAGTAGQTVPGTVIQHTGGLIALDRKSGSIKWRYVAPLSPTADFQGFIGSLAGDENQIVGATVDGTLMAFPAR